MQVSEEDKVLVNINKEKEIRVNEHRHAYMSM